MHASLFLRAMTAVGLAVPAALPAAAFDGKQVLQRRVGTWRTETVAKPAVWSPEGHKSEGVEVIKWTLGERFIQGDKTVPKDKMRAHWLATYDEQAEVFRFWYFDSSGGFPSGETAGRFDAKTQALRWESDMGKGLRGTGVWRFVSDDAMEWTYLVKDKDGKVYMDLTGKQVRANEPLEAPPVTSRVASDKKGKVLFTSNRDAKDKFQIYVMDDDGKSIKRLSKGDAAELDAALSPDGKRIAFAALSEKKDKGPTAAIFVINADGSGRKRLTKGDGIATGPAWSPDGKRIAYAEMSGPPGSGDFSGKIYIIDADGKNRKELGPGLVPSWSPDGKRIAYSTFGQGGRPSLHIRAVNGGEPKTFIEGIAMMATWSPDGKRIAYMGDGGDGEQPDIFVAGADGTGKTQLTKTEAIEVGIQWSADGKRVLFSRFSRGADSERGSDIHSIDLDGKDEKRLTGGKGMNLLSGASLFAVSRSGARSGSSKPESAEETPESKPRGKERD